MNKANESMENDQKFEFHAPKSNKVLLHIKDDKGVEQKIDVIELIKCLLTLVPHDLKQKIFEGDE